MVGLRFQKRSKVIVLLDPCWRDHAKHTARHTLGRVVRMSKPKMPELVDLATE
jgi:hypothetical protein